MQWLAEPPGATQTSRCDPSIPVRLKHPGATRVSRYDSNIPVRLEYPGATRVRVARRVSSRRWHFTQQMEPHTGAEVCRSAARLCPRLAGQLCTRLRITDVNSAKPSVEGPVSDSTACSGCGISPTTLPRPLQIPAMSCREPFGFPPR